MHQFANNLILALATYRFAILVTQDDGPADLCWRLRDAVKRRYPTQLVSVKNDYQYHGFEPGGKQGMTDSWQLRGIECPFCVSFWIGIVLWIAYNLAPRLTVALCTPLALSAVTVIIEKWSADSDE